MTKKPEAVMPPSTPAIDEGARWSIWIDIEGFGALWSKGKLAVEGLQALIAGIHLIGTRIYTGDGDRLFAHQFGDGFIIVADFHETALDRCASIAVALMRHVARSGCVARAAIAEGEFADISGLWPRSVREALALHGEDDTVALGSGLMTLLPVMGTALINANKLDARNPAKGAILTIATEDACRVSGTFPRQPVADRPEITVIDWVHTTSPDLDQIEARSGVGWGHIADLEAALHDYIETTTPPLAWIEGTTSFNKLVRR